MKQNSYLNNFIILTVSLSLILLFYFTNQLFIKSDKTKPYRILLNQQKNIYNLVQRLSPSQDVIEFNDIKIEKKDINNPHNYKYTINPGYDLCKTDPVLFVAFIAITPHQFQQRLTVRSTWANKILFPKMRVFFALGLSKDQNINEMIKKEAQRFNDIVQEDFIDSYHNLTNKIMMGFKWISDYCPQAEFVFRLNEDLMINPFAVTKFLELKRDKYNITNMTLMGDIIRNGHVFRDKNSKFYVSFEHFNKSNYDPYPEGSAYIITSDLAYKFFHLSTITYMPPFSVWLEDVYMGILATKLKKVTILNIQKYFTPQNQYQDLSKSNVIKELDKKTACSTLVLFCRDEFVFHWNQISMRMNFTDSFNEIN